MKEIYLSYNFNASKSEEEHKKNSVQNEPVGLLVYSVIEIDKI